MTWHCTYFVSCDSPPPKKKPYRQHWREGDGRWVISLWCKHNHRMQWPNLKLCTLWSPLNGGVVTGFTTQSFKETAWKRHTCLEQKCCFGEISQCELFDCTMYLWLQLIGLCRLMKMLRNAHTSMYMLLLNFLLPLFSCISVWNGKSTPHITSHCFSVFMFVLLLFKY